MRHYMTFNFTLCSLLLGIGLHLGAGCGSRSLPSSSDGGPIRDARVGPEAAMVAQDRGVPRLDQPGAEQGDCVIAIRLDDCCGAPFPAPRVQVDQDPCLVLYPVRGDVPQECAPVVCEDDCAPWPAPASRLVEALPGGGCAWKDECATNQDCQLATDVRQCCGCLEAYPRELLEQDPCLMPLNMSAYPPPGCDSYCSAGPGGDGDCWLCPVIVQAVCERLDSTDPGNVSRCGP